MKERALFFLILIAITNIILGQVIRNPLTNPGNGDEGDLIVGTIVKLIDDNIVIPCNEGERPSGAILLSQPMRNQPDQYQITTSGIVSYVLFAGDISAGDRLIPADDGAVKAFEAGDDNAFIIGTAVETGTVGDRKKILVDLQEYDGGFTTDLLGDFIDMQAEAVYQDIDVGDSWANIESIQIETGGQQTEKSLVVINASATITTDCTRWSGFPNQQWGFAYIRVVRDGTVICGSSNAVVGQYSYVYPIGSKFFGGSAALSITSFDTPPEGIHTYSLQYENSALDIIDHKPFGLSVVEIKK